KHIKQYLNAEDNNVEINPVLLSYYDSNIEDEFKKYYFKSSLIPLRFSLIFGLFFYLIFAVVDYIIIPEFVKQFYSIRFLYVAPITILVVALSYRANFYKWWQQGIVTIIIVATSGILIMPIISPETIEVNHFSGIILLMFYCFILVRLRFIWATMASLSMLALYFIASYFFSDISQHTLIINTFMLLTAFFLGMLSSYQIELSRRKEFLNRKLIKEEKEKVKKINSLLESKIENRNNKLLIEVKQHQIAEEKLEEDLIEKRNLVQELFHRTKNNMQIISSILNVNKSRIKDELSIQLIDNVNSKIRVMSLVQDKLYESNDLSKVNLGEYFDDILDFQNYRYLKRNFNISVKFDYDDIETLIDTAVPLGLIFEELISNIYIHAFPNNRFGSIEVALRKNETDEIIISIDDDGVGLDKSIDINNLETFGLLNAMSLIEYQLKGRYELNLEKGVHWKIYIKEELYQRRI
ncbi:MAG: hypothetical protein KAS49_01435, partial [Candidatus Cloacimonetes bacterium]|nr:hypothetical protein [Candidatus Cloacimonadota bacterium]